ncbi:MAG: hypothetical protein E7055_20395 [Lentisphaerae bacterium]|nr:hypothetical protein [Lentisphaerota bacterium]
MKAKRKIPKSPGPRSPKLAALETEIMEQHLQGKKIAAIQKWLKTEKKISIAYSNLYNFIHRRAQKFSETSGTAVILHFMRLKPEIREEVLQILLMLMNKESNIPPQKSIRKNEQVAPAPAAKPALEDYMKIQPGDSPAIIRLKKLATIDSTELEQFEEEMKAEKKR